MRQGFFIMFVLVVCMVALASEFAMVHFGDWTAWLPTNPERFTLWLVPPLALFTLFEVRQLWRSSEAA